MISIVIPLYNKEQAIIQTLESVLNQKGVDFEVVIVDDGSTDRSYTIVQSYAKQDSRIRLFKQENGGPGKARNMGIKHSKGNWLLLLDADDEILPSQLRNIKQIIKRFPLADIIDLNCLIQNGKKKTLRYHPLVGIVKNPMRAFFFQKIMPGNDNTVYRRKFLLNHLYDERIRRFEDAEILSRQLRSAKVYSSYEIVALHHAEFASASNPCKNVMDDYFAYLDFHKGGFWQRMCAYRCFLENRDLYPEYGHRHYKWMYYRYDLLLLFKLLNWWGNIFK